MIENSPISNANQTSKIEDKKILLVDSSERIRDALSLFFELEECEFLAVGTPEEALKALRKDNYDIIIADYHLPRLNGLEFLIHVKSNFKKTIEILTTSYSDRKYIEEAKKAGIRNVIRKPFSAETLILHLFLLLEKELNHER
jgi:two-component system chemotaxis response regulator CheY